LDDRPVEVWYPVEPAAVEGQSSEMFDSINAISEVLRPFIPGDLGGEVDTGTYRDAPPATEGGPFPTAAYSHGSPGYRQAATFLTGHLASHGVITIAVEHLGRSLSTLLTPLAGADTPEDDVADLLDALDLVGSDPGLGSVVDTSRMVVIGHSAGARTAALATADDRVVGVVLLAGVPQELATNRPALMVAFENDAVIDPAGIWSLHQSLDNSVFVNIAGTGHAAPIDACPLIQDRGGLTELREALGEAIVRAGEDGCLPKDTDARAVQDLLRIYITGFVYEALGLSEGPVNLTAEAADLVAGVELRGFNEPPTTTATAAPETTTVATTTTLQTAVSAPPTLEVLSQHPTVDCMNEVFDKFIDVFGMYVVATSGAPLAYVEHTANVLAEYIDNDADGIPDDQAVLDVLVNGNFVVPVWTESDRVSFWDNARGTYCEDNTGMAASMYYEYDEWALGGIEAAGTWDGNLEEVWHVVSIGWYATYPEYFGDEPGVSRLTEAMDTARGGQFLTIPSTYPAGSWYRYYDDTCEYGCQMHEYFYWILMANIDALDPSITDKCEQSQHEWHICNKAELEQVDVLAFDLFNNHGFSLPTNIPTGNYQPFGN
jgi:pimeloyl-ACP methyl ester carboxylesterase